MSSERSVEPTPAQLVETAQNELRAEERAMEALLRKRAQHQAHLEHLQAEREKFLRELEALRQGRPMNAPRLPEPLSPPFTIRGERNLRSLSQLLLVLLFMSMPVTIFLVAKDGTSWHFVALWWGVLGIMSGVGLWTGWRFGRTHIEAVGLPRKRVSVPYKEVVAVEVAITPSQRRRGVGTVVMRFGAHRGNVGIQDVPEPERLAEWLRAKRSDIT